MGKALTVFPPLKIFTYVSLVENRFRKFLRDQLRKDGWKVNMVGSKSEGTMADNVRELCLL